MKLIFVFQKISYFYSNLNQGLIQDRFEISD